MELIKIEASRIQLVKHTKKFALYRGLYAMIRTATFDLSPVIIKTYTHPKHKEALWRSTLAALPELQTLRHPVGDPKLSEMDRLM